MSLPIARYGVAPLAVGVAMAAWEALVWAAGGGLPHFVTMYPAVMVTALLCGLGPGLLATVLAAVAAAWWIIPPQGAFFPMTLPDAVGLGLFSCVAVFLCAVAEGFRRSRRREAALEVESAMREQEARAAAIRSERQRFVDVLNMLPVSVVLLTPDYRIPFANRFFEDRFGKADGQRCYEHLFHHTAPCENCETYGVLETNAPHQWEWTGPDGHKYDISCFPFRDTDGSPLILEMGINVTQRKHAEEEVRRASRYARSLIEASLDPLVTISPEGQITNVNRATKEVTGVGRERLVGSDFSGYFTKPEKANAGYRKVLAEGHVHDYPLSIRHASGRTTDVHYNATVYRNESGEVQGVFAAARDITERKRAEEALRQSAELGDLVQLLDMASVMVLDLDHRITRWNTGCRRLYGHTAEHAVGRISHELLRTRFPEPLDKMRATLTEKGRWKGELVHTTSDGREVAVASEWLLWRDAAGRPAAILEANTDITEQKRVEEALRRTAEELDRSNKDLEQFAYVASHDLQEPLRMVTGYLQLLGERYKSKLDAKADTYIDYAVDGALRMSTLINDLLAYSRVNTRGEALRPTSAAEAFDFALRNLRAAIDESGAAVTCDPLPVVRADGCN